MEVIFNETQHIGFTSRILLILGGVLLICAFIYYMYTVDNYEILETPSGGIIDKNDLPPVEPRNMSIDPVDVGIEGELFGPLYPLPERPPYAKMAGLPYNFPPLQNDIQAIANNTAFSNR